LTHVIDTGTGGRSTGPAGGSEPGSAVVIVGAGPVGLMLAIELRLAGIEPIVLERLPEISEIPKGNGLVGHVVRTLDYRGLLEPLRAESTYSGPVPAFSFGPLQLDFSGLPESPLHVLAIPQRRLEHVLATRLAELGGTVRRGHEMTSFDSVEGGVTNGGAANSGAANSGAANSGAANSGAANSGAANSGAAVRAHP
jgi:2-polyprenyl-6-methoxyphenol hydroxylase-like FAD-dependent oxidoreductase